MAFKLMKPAGLKWDNGPGERLFAESMNAFYLICHRWQNETTISVPQRLLAT